MQIHEINEKLGRRYQVREFVVETEMSLVYRAEDEHGHDVALKILTHKARQDTDLRTRFEKEARFTRELTKPNLVQTIDFLLPDDENPDNLAYIAMKWLPGGSVKDRIKQRREKSLETRDALNIAAHLLKSLAPTVDYLHKRGLVHRDIKPSNIMFDDEGVPYLMDFGIAKIPDNLLKTGHRIDRTAEDRTAVFRLMGSLPYMSPEQCSFVTLDGRSDQYSLALVVYELLSGHSPYQKYLETGTGSHSKQITEGANDSIESWSEFHRLNEPQSLQLYAPDINESIWRILKKALSKKPEDRYLTIEAFADAFEAAFENPEDDEKPGKLSSIYRLISPKIGIVPRPILLAIIVMIILILVILSYLIQSSSAIGGITVYTAVPTQITVIVSPTEISSARSPELATIPTVVPTTEVATPDTTTIAVSPTSSVTPAPPTATLTLSPTTLAPTITDTPTPTPIPSSTATPIISVVSNTPSDGLEVDGTPVPLNDMTDVVNVFDNYLGSVVQFDCHTFNDLYSHVQNTSLSALQPAHDLVQGQDFQDILRYCQSHDVFTTLPSEYHPSLTNLFNQINSFRSP